MIKVGVNDPSTLWNEEDEKFYIRIKKFGIYVERLAKDPEAPNNIISLWVEDWEIPLLQKIMLFHTSDCFEKYKYLRFFGADDNNKPLLVISGKNFFWYSVQGKNNG